MMFKSTHFFVFIELILHSLRSNSFKESYISSKLNYKFISKLLVP